MESAVLTLDRPVSPATHAHHWRIDEAHGPRSGGVCKTCGAVKEFKNWIEDGDFITNEEHRQAAA